MVTGEGYGPDAGFQATLWLRATLETESPRKPLKQGWFRKMRPSRAIPRDPLGQMARIMECYQYAS